MAKKTEELEFTMAPEMLYDIIMRQAGTLEKAIAEGAMNAADAKARVCNITVTPSRVMIEDDGTGFPSREEIDKFFKVFGTRHTSEENKVYGTFRMGRGQLFKFGHNVWRSGQFEMDVDVKHRGFKWTLTTHGHSSTGCKIVIDLYDKLSPGAMASVIKEVGHLIRYLEISGTEAYLNGEKISVDPITEKWDFTMEEGYVRLRRTGNLDVYNLGVLVKGYPDHQFGTGGVVVAGKQLMVNFARNDVMVGECKVWRTLMKDVRRLARESIERTPTLNESERARLAQDILDGEVDPQEAYNLRIFTDVCGRHWSVHQIIRKSSEYRARISLAPQGSNVGDTVHKMGLAFILGTDTSERFRKDLKGLATLIQQVYRKACSWASADDKLEPVEFDEVSKSMNTKAIIVPEKLWTPAEQLMMGMAQRGIGHLTYAVGKANGQGDDGAIPRNLLVGSAETLLGWTDGTTYIALERRLLTMNKLNIHGVLEMYDVLLHEVCHDGPDSGTHRHTHEFYQIFHDCLKPMLHQAISAFKQLPRQMENMQRKLTPKQLRDLDYLFKAEEGLGKFSEKLAACAEKAVAGMVKKEG